MKRAHASTCEDEDGVSQSDNADTDGEPLSSLPGSPDSTLRPGPNGTSPSCQLSEEELPGPASYEELFAWPKRFLRKLSEFVSNEDQPGVSSGEVFRHHLCSIRRLVLTTSFSGVGSAEVAASMISHELQAEGVWHRDALQVHSACELRDSCRKVLMAHGKPSGANHVFKDIVRGFSDHVERKIRQKLASLRKTFSESTENEPQDRVARRQVHEQMVAEFHCFAEHILQEEEVQLHFFCEHHRRMCPRVPCREPGDIWVEAAGSPCISFCKGGGYGTQLGWLHDTSLPFLAWVSFLRKGRPDVVVHECVDGFEPHVLCRYLNCGCPPDKPLCTMESVSWNILWEGFTVSRHRRYTLCVLTQHCPAHLSFQEVVERLLFAKRCLGGDIFLQAPAEDIEAVRTDWAMRRRLPAQRVSSQGVLKPWAWEALLTPSHRKLLLSMRQKAEQQMDEWANMSESDDDDNEARHAAAPSTGTGRPLFQWLVNLSQSEKFQPPLKPMSKTHCPTVICSSRFFVDSNDPRKARAMHPLECHAMQGQPVYLSSDHPMRSVCDMEAVLRRALADGVNMEELLQMAGNSVNVSAIGHAMLFALAAHTWPVFV